MSNIDIILGVLILGAGLHGYKKGFISSIIFLVGLIATFVLLSRYIPLVKNGLVAQFGLSSFASTFFAILLIIMLVSIIMSIVKLLINHLASILKLTIINKFMGAAVGMLCMILLISIFFAVIKPIPFPESIKNNLNNSIIFRETQNIYLLLQPSIENK